ncbi:MAG TPA: hypothetical protein VH083_19795 [Myxococcales bacterium]|nr:hypothetical protein [Myxococcales bacterium]
MYALLFAALLAATAHHKPKAVKDARTEGLGHSCKVSKDCKSKSQRCLHESDVNNKPVAVGFCVLPCLPLEAGTTKVVPGAPLEATPQNAKDKKIPRRCPLNYSCRDQGQGVPIDMCVKE